MSPETTQQDLVRIRDLEPDDLHEVMRIENACFGTPWEELAFVAEMLGPLSVLAVMERQGRVVGYVNFRVILDESHLLNIAVDPELQGQGLGQKLLCFAFAEARRQKAERMFLEVRPSNRPAVAMYKAFGFKQVGLRRKYYSDTGEDALVLEASLTNAPC